MKDCSSVQLIREDMVIEHLLNMLPEDICAWVKERKHKASMAAEELADDYLQAHKVSAEQKVKAEPSKKQEKQETPSRSRCHVCEEDSGLWTSDCTKKGNPSQRSWRNESR